MILEGIIINKKNLKVHFVYSHYSFYSNFNNIIKSTVRGRIDQVNQVLELESNTQSNAAPRYNALQKWCEQLSNLHTSIASKIIV